jgi:acyl-CoA reductase-like NAD-dependent aldehyde dehydrogenase
MSGIGREGGRDMIHEYLQVKAVWMCTITDVPNPFILR